MLGPCVVVIIIILLVLVFIKRNKNKKKYASRQDSYNEYSEAPSAVRSVYYVLCKMYVIM